MANNEVILLTLSLREKGNKQRWIASQEVALIFKVSRTSRKAERRKLGSSMGMPPNCICYTIETMVGLSSRLIAVMGDLVMLGVMSLTPGTA